MAKSTVRIIFFLFLGFYSFAQKEDINKKDSAIGLTISDDESNDVRPVRVGWLFNAKDDPGFARIDLNDSDWIKTSSTLTTAEIEKVNFNGFGWFRCKLKLNSNEIKVPNVIYIHHKGASEIYIDGILMGSFGKVGKSEEDEDRIDPYMEPVYLPIKTSGEYQIAVRYSNHNWNNSYNFSGAVLGGFEMFVSSAKDYYMQSILTCSYKSNYGLAIFIFFLTVGLLHLLLYLFYPVHRSNVFFAIFCFIFSFYFFYGYAYGTYIDSPDTQALLNFLVALSFPQFFISFQSVLYSLFDGKFRKAFKFYFIFAIISSLSFFVSSVFGVITTLILIVTIAVDSVIFLVKINKEKRKGALFITVGFGGFIVFLALSTLKLIFTGSFNPSGNNATDEILMVLLGIGMISIPLSMSAYLAWDFSQTSKVLSKKLVEVEELSARTLEQEKEKQKILAEQNEVLEIQVEERTKEINEQKKVIEEKNKDITDSINYAQRIQRSILPTDVEIKEIFKDSFVLFKPRDIVSGDFYQFKKRDSLRYAILADCTGHGVPGALMSMIGSNLLHQIIIERNIKEPNMILKALHREVRSTLRQTSGITSHDGMDAAIVLLDEKKLFISSANRPVYIVKKGELTELKPDKRSIGGSSVGDDVTFNLNELELEEGMMIYLFSDGYADQFGGEQGKKFKVKNLADLLVSVSAKSLDAQKEILNSTFDNWKKHLEQVDDVSLVGLRF